MKWKSDLLVPPRSLFRVPPIFLEGGYRKKKANTSSFHMLKAYPISVYNRKYSGKIEWKGFVYAFLYTAKDKETTLWLEYPLCFSDNKGEIRKVYRRLIDEVTELAFSASAKRILFEGYTLVGGRICFPSASTVLGSYNQTDIIPFLKERGFKKRLQKYCFELNPLEVLRLDDVSLKRNRECFVRSFTGSIEERRLYWKMWSESEYCHELIAPEEYGFRDLTYSYKLLSRREYVQFLEIDGKIVGFSHWIPDIYPLVRRYGEPPSFINLQSRYGKIFKLILLEKPKFLLSNLIVKTVEVMYQHHIYRCQIGNILSGDLIFLELMKKWKGHLIHKLEVLEKNL